MHPIMQKPELAEADSVPTAGIKLLSPRHTTRITSIACACCELTSSNLLLSHWSASPWNVTGLSKNAAVLKASTTSRANLIKCNCDRKSSLVCFRITNYYVKSKRNLFGDPETADDLCESSHTSLRPMIYNDGLFPPSILHS